jgi:osmotically-inducible protein OsmY
MSQRAMDTIDHPPIAEEKTHDMAIMERAHHFIDTQQHFHQRADQFVFACDKGVLTVEGSVPSFYLKQVLQNALRLVPGVRAVHNRVTVVSAQGMSSIAAE